MATCAHVATLKNNQLLEQIRFISSQIITPTSQLPPNNDLKVILSQCHICKKYQKRLYACVQCVFVGCYDHSHIQHHAKVAKHQLAIDTLRGTLFCTECGKHIYDPDVENIHCQRMQLPSCKGHLKQVYKYNYWRPSAKEVQLLSRNNTRYKLSLKSKIGLKGLANLGNTCFMNSIVQALVHTPILRDYFLSDKHQCSHDNNNTCIACELASIFQKFYSVGSLPHIPNKLLYLIWTNARHMAGYVQQDAHEFLIAILNALHGHFKRELSSSFNEIIDNNCRCIVHQIFAGNMQSDVTCQKCGNTSTTIDPFFDISMDIGSLENERCDLSSASTVYETGANSSVTLLNCLDRFTHAETLDHAKLKCHRCHEYSRFEHSKKFGRKITTYVAFSDILDMKPYVSKLRINNGESGHADNQNAKSCSSSVRYCLFAVINHSGTLDSGHYTCYVRQPYNQWFECDDAKIRKATTKDVLSSEGYLLFYHRETLDYE
ncbi:uncharacterized protein TRIADDRAFT_52906 [Trichoplax adhaerens]|uniref:Ubiquitin carboxyl-terminal hydrolase n=1 Tax=Trichoplax adhaerens TaxID=10228 RepID=B3RMS5_TRIAD|nr:hypothetical protein TRIADDRAFT_52906 [Trichoplax adhaerens]EDV27900.1 hypothetical protein TRIADDRAFT_52906 [Trichoplax adhaerens]|eukprot:XP_002109734.1 hypothetical protein TRIADDRAFT_52906 [Trichoplax adhaerens]